MRVFSNDRLGDGLLQTFAEAKKNFMQERSRLYRRLRTEMCEWSRLPV